MLPCQPAYLIHVLTKVLTTVGHLLEPVTGIFEPFPRWYRLTRKKASDKVSGEVCLIIVVVPKYIYQVLNWSEDSQTLLDPQMLQVGYEFNFSIGDAFPHLV